MINVAATAEEQIQLLTDLFHQFGLNLWFTFSDLLCLLWSTGFHLNIIDKGCTNQQRKTKHTQQVTGDTDQIKKLKGQEI